MRACVTRCTPAAAAAAGVYYVFEHRHNAVMIAYMVSMLVLFANFFINNYGGAKGAKKITKKAD